MKLSGPVFGLAFLAAVDRALEQVVAWPETGTPVPGVSAELPVRKLSIPRFPYYLAYLVTDDAIRVLAVAHERRRATGTPAPNRDCGRRLRQAIAHRANDGRGHFRSAVLRAQDRSR
jgi:plasmid stabilization system protein ParE